MSDTYRSDYKQDPRGPRAAWRVGGRSLVAIVGLALLAGAFVYASNVFTIGRERQRFAR